ncbi:hypothetical protein Tco_1398412 [Tanacetum coccineum]
MLCVGGTAVGGGDGDIDDGSDGKGDLDLIQDEDGKSDGGGGEDDDVKSDGGDDNDGISDGTVWVWSDSAVSLRSSSDKSSPEFSRWPHQAGVRSGDDGEGLTGKVVISSSESDMMTNGANTPVRSVVAGKGVRRGAVIVL